MKRFAIVSLLLSALIPLSAARADTIWLEGEAGQTTAKNQGAGGAPAGYLSGDQWLQVMIDEEKIAQDTPPEGILIRYAFSLTKGGAHEIWNRIGYEFVRSPFEWRLDQGEWKQVSPDELTTDLMELSFFREVAWLQLGKRDLAAGAHTLEIKLPRVSKGNNKFNRILYASDCLCITDQPFHPHSRFKPEETGRTDRDEAATRQVFELPSAQPGQRSQISLKGDWEITRDDEQAPGEVAAPMAPLPSWTAFSAIPVPSDKNVSRPDLVFAHRLWYRTRVAIPAALAGRSFQIEFPLNNLNTTVYVNGQYCGFGKNPFCPFTIDITKGAKAGTTNEIWVGIRDTWYGRAADPARPMKLRRTFNVPLKFIGDGFQHFDYPVWNCPQAGLLATPVLHASGGAYVSDLFIKPSVERKALDSEVTVANTGASKMEGEIRQEVLEAEKDQVVVTLGASPFAVEAGQSATVNVSHAWSNPSLWWPDSPTLYRLRTSLVGRQGTVDQQVTRFGFREWQIKGHQITLNGIPWHLWADIGGPANTAESWLAGFRESNIRIYRFYNAGQGPHDPHWFGLEYPAALDYLDSHGIIVRRNATLDGEVIGYHFREDDAETIRQQNGSKIKQALMRNWRDQCVAQVRGERNHPSIQIWSIENEFAFINLINLLGNTPEMDEYEVEIRKTHDAVRAVDPTRGCMTDGGGALKENVMSIHGDHYIATLDTRYPDLAYEAYPEGAGRGRWKWDQQRPRYIGEDYFATGMDPADFAMWGGEIAFQGKAAVKDSMALCYRMLCEGYRWGGYYFAWHFWIGNEGGPREWVANAPRAVFCRQWDWTFGSDQTVPRTFGIFNDTHDARPIVFTRSLTIGSKTIWTRNTTHTVAPGTAEKFDESLAMPAVKARTEAVLTLTLSVGGTNLFSDTKAVSILPPPAYGGTRIRTGDLLVLDPANRIAPFLKAQGIAAQPILSLTNLPPTAKVLLVGSDAIAATECASPALAAYAAAGHAVVVLDQATPLRYQAFPAEMDLVATSKEPFAADGHTGFIEDSSHPILKGFRDKDFFTSMGPDTWLYRNAYVKPEKGGKSLLQVGPRLTQTALVEIPAGKGILWLCQLKIGDRVMSNAVDQQLVLNLLAAGMGYRQEFAGVTAYVQDAQLAQALDALGLQYTKASDPLAALKDPARRIAILSGTPATLKTLVGAKEVLAAFYQRGGTLILHGVPPAGLADLNTLTGVQNLMRPFIRERVQFPAVRNPLTAGLSSGDIVLYSGKRVFGFRSDEFTVDDEFTHVVDYDEVAPFATSDFASYDKIVNGFIGADGWPQIIDFPIPDNNQPFNIHIKLPREETVTEFTFDPSVNYNPTTKIALLFDGKDRVEYTIPAAGEATTLAVNPPRKASEVTLQLCDWQIDPAKAHNTGIDNIWLRVQRSPEFLATVKPLFNVGGMMQYLEGNGSLILCNLKFQENEAVPANKGKKRAILATVLRNLKAPFTGGKTVIAGANLISTPVDIHTKATTYKDERGWFGDKMRTFAGLPAGLVKLGGVEYNIYEMATSPVPQVLMLGGRGVPGNLPQSITGIPVNLKADALFFLHTARIDSRMSEKDRAARKPYVMFKYVVNYADGQKVEIPISSELDIEHFAQKSPALIPGAQLAWQRPYDNSDEKAVAYAKQWNNPRPDAVIQSVDMVAVDRARGVPVLLALTAVKTE